MENRTKLKEKRKDTINIAWVIISFFIPLLLFYKYDGDEQVPFAALLGTQICFLLYRVITYGFNSLLLVLFGDKGFKLNRLKGRVTPIYKIYESRDEGFCIEKFSAHYTKLGLQWSIPFSVLFEEQEYISDGKYFFKTVPEDIAEAWEQEYNLENCIEDSILRKKLLKQQKLNNLNKVFNENYK